MSGNQMKEKSMFFLGFFLKHCVRRTEMTEMGTFGFSSQRHLDKMVYHTQKKKPKEKTTTYRLFVSLGKNRLAQQSQL